MAVDPTAASRTDLQTELPAWPSISNPDMLRELQVPVKVIEDRKLLSHFFSVQSSRLTALEHTEKLKSMPAEIHDFVEIESELMNFSPLAEGEERLLDDFYQSLNVAGQRVTVQSEVQDLIDHAEQYVQEHPTAAGPSGAASGGTLDLFDQVFMMEQRARKDENDKKYRELLVAAKDPETIMLIIAYRYTDLYGRKLAKAMSVYKDQMEVQEKWAKGMVSNASAVEVAKANAELARNSSFMGMATFAIQSIKQKTDEVQNISKSVLEAVNDLERQFIANLKG